MIWYGTEISGSSRRKGSAVSQATKTNGETGRASRDLEDLSFYLGRCYYAYLDVLQAKLAETGLDAHLRPGMGNILFALFERDGRSLGEISNRLGVAPSTMTGVVREAIRLGVVRTLPDPGDGRSKRLWLEPKARALEPKCRKLSRELNAILRGEMSAAEAQRLQRQLASMLERLRPHSRKKT